MTLINEHLDAVVAAAEEYTKAVGTDREDTQRAIVHERVQRWLDATVEAS